MSRSLRPALGVLLAASLRASARAASPASDFALPEATSAPHIEYKADVFDYVRSSPSAEGSSSTMHLQGHVWVKESTWTIRAGELWLDLDSRQGQAYHGFVMDDGQSQLSGENGDFDFADHTGQVYDSLAEYPPWRIWSRAASSDEERRAHFKRAYFTGCNVIAPHYHFWASSLHVKPKNWLYGWNVFFFIGKVPLFYTPFLYKSLDPNPWLHTRVVPGYEAKHGGTLRSTTLFTLSRSAYGKLFVDHYGKERPGFGGEMIYKGSEGRGGFYGYRILDRPSRERWTMTGDLFQTLFRSSTTSLALQGRLQAQKDADFNNDYQRSSTFRVADQLVNNGALVYYTRWINTRISYSRLDVEDPTFLQFPDDPRHGRYLNASESFPRFDWSTTSFKWKYMPVLLSFSGFKDTVHVPGVPYTQHSAGITGNLTQTYRLFRGVVLTPSGSFSETYQNKLFSPTNSFNLTPPILANDAITARYQLGGNLRAMSPFGVWDLGHTYIKRFKPGTLRVDADAPDYGVEKNSLNLQDTLRPNRTTLLRVGSAYNYQVYRDTEVFFRRRFDPFVGDLILTPGHQVQVSLRDVYNLDLGNQSFLMQVDWGDRLGQFVGMGITHTLNRNGLDIAEQYIGASEFGIGTSSSTWRILGTLRYTAKVPAGIASTNTLAVFEKEISIGRRFHDFNVRIILRERPIAVREFLFRVDMRLGQKTTEDHIVRKDWESEWFPWRRSGVDDR